MSQFARTRNELRYNNLREIISRRKQRNQGNRLKMELRKDPITRSWVVVGHPERGGHRPDPCVLCPEHRIEPRSLVEIPGNGPWQVRVIPHFRPLYRIEGDPGRCAEGIYDSMSAVGAHEIIVETRDHLRSFSHLSDEEITRVLEVYALRISDLKRDARFKFVSIFKNQGPAAAEDWAHAHSQVMATTFVPRRMSYELRAAREWYRERERCVFCDVLRQEIRQKKRLVECVGDYYAICPYASRVPYEVWILPKTHNHQFESPAAGERRAHLATLLGRTLRRIGQITNSYHMVLHTAPNTLQTKGELSKYWQTISGDYHWHFEILPIVSTTSKSYGLKEVYFNGILPEEAAGRLRQLEPEK